MANITNTTHETLITGTSAADYVYNEEGNSVTINTGAGNDYVDNDLYNDYAKINTGAGNDSVFNFCSDDCTINTGEGDDSVYNDEGDYCTINTSAGNDSVFNYYSWYCTINTGAGNDLISLDSSSIKNVIKYSSGDGNDKIYGFNETSTLSISGGSYSSQKSGDNIIVTVGDGKISLMGDCQHFGHRGRFVRFQAHNAHRRQRHLLKHR